jgi:XRE family transcriptional regulator, master regulator for biofilm formation
LDTTVEYLLGNQNLKDARLPVDEEWAGLVDEAIKNGLSKEDFAYYLDFMKFQSRSKQDK